MFRDKIKLLFFVFCLVFGVSKGMEPSLENKDNTMKYLEMSDNIINALYNKADKLCSSEELAKGQPKLKKGLETLKTALDNSLIAKLESFRERAIAKKHPSEVIDTVDQYLRKLRAFTTDLLKKETIFPEELRKHVLDMEETSEECVTFFEEAEENIRLINKVLVGMLLGIY
ncbi:MAG: hypothetical protein LBB29_01660 [Holosporaceae bacterium]|nr:hypothetical protein [Holosporaceae bacterium]